MSEADIYCVMILLEHEHYTVEQIAAMYHVPVVVIEELKASM